MIVILSDECSCVKLMNHDQYLIYRHINQDIINKIIRIGLNIYLFFYGW